MEEDDDFGDLYEDALEENLSFPPNPAPVRSQVTYEQEFDDDEELLYGKASPSSSQQQAARAPSLSQQAARAPSLSQQAPRAPSLSQQASVAEGFDLSVNEAQQDTEPGGVIEQDGAKEESETKLNYSENDEVGAHAQASVQGDFVEKTEISMGGREDELNKENAENPVSGSVAFETDQEEKNDRDLAFTPTELPDSENVFQFEVENGLPQQDDIPGIGVVMNGVTTSIPGLSRDYGEIEEDGEGNGENWVAEGSSARQDLTPPTDLAVAESQGLQEDNGWDSDSEDDLQIVLNDDRAVYPNVERREWDFEEGSEDEDGDDLVIVAGGDNPIEEQEWGAETTLSFEGAVPAPTDKALPTDKTGDDKGQTGKGNIGIGNAVVPRAGYGSQHYHSHYSQYKYVRPGAASIPGGISGASGGAANHSRNAIPSGGVWAPGKGGVPTTGRGDWSSSGGRGFVQRSFLSGAGMPPWSNVPGGRGFQNGFEFSLPPNKTVFEIDIDSFEEKPWKLPGTDITDFFNFKLDEDSWKEYCRKLEQHKLEATMQSKIRVYESGRSEQEYDPDLPIELATATGRNEAFGESTQHKLSDPGSAASVGRGRGLGRGRATLPTGRAIQVESGVGERRPSVDFRRQRNHDADAVIEIVLQDASEDDTTGPLKAPESANDIIEREESERGEIEMGYQKQVNTESSLQARHMESWERDDVSKKIISGGAMIPRTLHHGDGILPLPPGPPIHCQPGSSAGPMFPARILDQQHVNRRPQLVKPHKGFPQIGNEYSNGSIANQDARGGRAESYRKEVIGDGVERTEILEIGCTMADTEREPTPDVRCTNVEQHPMNELQINSRSDGQSKPNSEVKLDEDTIDDHGSDHSVKRQKLSSQNESPATAAGYSHHFKVSKSGNSKAESGNSRGYSKDRGNSRDCSRGRGNGDEEISQYRPSKRMAKEGNKLQSEEEPYLYQKEYLWNSRHSNERDSRHQRSRENPNHHRDDQYLYHGDREEIYRRRVKEERTDKHRERGEYVKAWQGKNEDMRSLREKDEDSRRRDILTKEDGLQHRDRGHDTERDDRQDLLNVRKKKDEDDWRPRLDKEDSKRGEREDNNPVRLEKMDDPYFRRKRDEDLLWKERADKVEITRDMREREDMGGEKHEKADDYRRRRKEEDLQRREKLDKDQSIRDLRDKEDMAREKHEREYGYLRRKDEDLSRRERSDKDQGIRDLRDREDMHREKHERDDESLRRKEEDLRRRERADKDEGLRDLREREDMSREKQERDDDHHLRRREEESRRRTLFDDSRARKQRDDSWRRREREDEHWRKPGFEEVHVRRDREEDKSMLGGRSRHHSEEKMWHGSDRERGRSREEASLSNIDKDRLKEKRRHEEQRGKVKERVDDTSRSRHHERDDMYSRMDRVIYDDRSSRLDRSHLRYDHSGSAHSGEDQKLHWEKRSYDHRNGSASGLVDDRVRHDHALTSRRRKTEDYHTMHHEKKPLERSTEDQESGSVWGVNADRRTHNRTTPPGLSKRMHEQEMTDRYPSKLKRVAADDSASEDEHVKRGRSKLERWASQKERDDASKWDNDTSKHQKTPFNHEESAAGKEEQGTESKRKPGKERPHSREQDDHTANQDGKEAVSNEHVHVADGTRSDADQGGSRQHFETVAKLEKRRERFKQPIPNEKETQKKAENEALLENETDEVKQERPARKRRWGGSSS